MKKKNLRTRVLPQNYHGPGPLCIKAIPEASSPIEKYINRRIAVSKAKEMVHFPL